MKDDVEPTFVVVPEEEFLRLCCLLEEARVCLMRIEGLCSSQGQRENPKPTYPSPTPEELERLF